MAVKAPEFGLYVDVGLQRLAVNIAQPNLQVVEVGKDVCPGLYLVQAPETEYLIRTDLRKSCGVVRVGENEPAFLDKLILIWKQPWGHIRGFFLNGDARNKKKMRLFEFTIYCNDPIPSELQQKFLELYCIGAFGSNSDVVGCFEKLLLQEKTDGEEA